MSIIMIWVYSFFPKIHRYYLMVSCLLVLESVHFDSVIRLGSISNSAFK